MDLDTPLFKLTVGEFLQLQSKPTSPTKPTIPETFGMDTLAKITGNSKSNLYKRMPEIPHGRNGGKLIFFRDEILQWLRDSKVRTRKERLDDLKDIL